MRAKLFFLGTLILLVVMGILAFLFFMYPSMPNFYSIKSGAEPTSIAIAEQYPDFAAARELFNKQDYAGALALYKKVLSEVSDVKQRGLVEYNIALSMEFGGDYMGAIPLFKQIGANASYEPATRASAIQEMANIPLRYGFSDGKAIIAEIYKDAPYSDFYADKNDLIAQRKTFEYAAAISPLPLSLVTAGELYALDVWRNYKDATTTEPAKSYIKLALSTMTQGENATLALEQDPFQSASLTTVYQREGDGLAYLAYMNAVDASRVESAYKKSIQASEKYTYNPFAYYDYAAFLVNQFGTSRASDIADLLKTVIEKSSDKNATYFVTFLKDAKKGNFQATYKRSIVKLAAADAAFKTYLVSLGWQESDFTSK